MKARKGASIVLILIMVMLLSVLGTQVLVTLNSETKANMSKVDDTQAAYVAQAMAEAFQIYMDDVPVAVMKELYKEQKDKNLLVKEGAPITKIDDKYYTEFEISADKLKMMTSLPSGDANVDGDMFKGFKALGILRMYESTDLNNLKVRAEGFYPYAVGADGKPVYASHGIDIYVKYDFKKNNIEEHAMLIAKNSIILGRKVEGKSGKITVKCPNIVTPVDKVQQFPFKRSEFKYLFPRDVGVDDFENMETLLKETKYTNEFKLKNSNTDSSGNPFTVHEKKIVSPHIFGIMKSTRNVGAWQSIKNLIKGDDKTYNEEKYINATASKHTYFGGLKRSKPAFPLNGGEGLKSGRYESLQAVNRFMRFGTAYGNPDNINNWMNDDLIIINTEYGEKNEDGVRVVKIFLDELTIQNPVVIKGDGLVHFYVKDRVTIENSIAIYTKSFVFTDRIDGMASEYDNNLRTYYISPVTIFYEGTAPVRLAGTIEHNVNIVAPNADVVLKPAIGKNASGLLHGSKNKNFRGSILTGGDIEIENGFSLASWANSGVFKNEFKIEGLFYAPYGNIYVNVKRPTDICGTMIAENIYLNAKNSWISYEDIKLSSNEKHSYNYDELNRRGIKIDEKKYVLKFMQNTK